MLTALPACQLQGQAPMAIPPGSDTPVACTAQWQVEGVQFKAIPLPAGDEVNDTTNSIDYRRNLLAYWCFGTAQLAGLDVDPFTFNPAYRGLDQLASTDLTPCDLPLCVFYWDSGTITFVDNWSVRRRTTRPDVSGAPWSAALADQRSADGEARFLQFQDQISDLVSRGVSRKTVASQAFGTLPPVGFLPVAPSQFVRDVAMFSQGTGVATVSTDEAAAGRRPASCPSKPLACCNPGCPSPVRSRASCPVLLRTPGPLRRLPHLGHGLLRPAAVLFPRTSGHRGTSGHRA